MKSIVLLVLFMSSFLCYSQKIYSVNYSNQADLKVFVVNYANQADKKIYFVDYPNQSDLKIFFVDYANQAGWRSKEKKHLLF